MAQTIDIIIKIQQAGIKTIDDVVRKLGEINAIVARTDTAPVERLNQGIQQINKSVSGIESNVKGVIGSIVNQTDNALTGTVDKFSDETGRAIETLYTRSTVAIGSIFFLGQERIALFIEKALTAPGLVASLKFIGTSFQTSFANVAGKAIDYVAERGTQLKTMLTGFGEVAMDTPVWLATIQSRIARIGLPEVAQQVNFIGFAMRNVVGYIAKSAALGGVFLFARVWLSETGMLVRRLTGHGEAAMRPLERATRLLTTLDSSVASIGFTSGQAVKTISLGLLTIWGPFSGIVAGIPFINSLVTSLLGIGLHFRMSVLASFGSARAQFTLIFLDFKKLALVALPVLIGIANQFKTMRGEASYAGDGIKKVGENADKLKVLQGLSRTKLPIGMQIQAISIEVKTMLGEVLLQITKISLLTQKSMNLAKTDIATIDQEAKTMTGEVAKSVEKSAQIFDKFGKKTGMFEDMKRQWRSLTGFFASKDTMTAAIRDQAGRATPGSLAKSTAKGAGVAAYAAITSPVTVSMYAAEKLVTATRSVATSVAAIFGRVPKIITNGTAVAMQAANNVKLAQPGRFAKLEVLSKQEVESAATVSQFGAVKTAINSANDALKSYSSTLASVSRSTATLATASTNSFSQIAQVVAELPAKLTGVSAKISEAIKAALPASQLKPEVASVNKYGREYRSSIPPVLQGIISGGIIPQAQQLAAGKQIPGEAVLANLRKFSAEVEKIQQKLGTGSLPGLESLAKNLQNISNIKTDKIKDALPKFEETISKLIATAATLDVKGKNTGDKFVSLLTRAIKEKNPVAEEAVAALAELIASYFPQSPAKKGALRGLSRSGSLIPSYIASGIESGKASTNKAATDIAEGIAKHFPRSLPVLGPLVHLISMGVKIPFYIAIGIYSAVHFVLAAARYIAGQIAKAFTTLVIKPFAFGYRIASGIAEGLYSGLQYVINAARKLAEPIAKIFETSEQTGVSVEAISALQNAFARLGGSVDDAKFAFNQINSLLGRTLNEEELVKVRQLGIDLASVRQANEPTLALLLQVSDAIKGLPPQSEKFRAALELLGITAQSSLVTVLRQGSDAIKALMAQGVDLGLTVSEETAKAAKEFVGINAQLDLIKTTILNDLMAAALPRLVEGGNKVLEIIGKVRPQITALLTIAGNGLVALSDILIAFVNMAINDPKKAMDVLERSLTAFLNLMKALLSQTWDIIKSDAKDFIMETGTYMVRLAWSLVSNLFSELQKEVKFQFNKLTGGIFAEIKALDVLIPGSGLARKILGDKAEWQATSDLGGSIGRAITTSMDDAEKATTKYMASAKKAATGVASDENVKKFKETWAKFAEEMKGAVAGTELESLGKKLADALTIKNFNETLTKIENIKDEQIKAVRDVASESTKINDVLAAENAARERREEARRSSAARLQELQMRSRANPFDDALKNDIALMEMEAKQKDELAAYEKLESDKTKVSEYAANQRKELENLAAQQRHEATLKQLDLFQSSAQSVGQMFGDLYDLSKGKVKEFFYIQKAAALAEAVVNTAAGITKALAQGGVWGIAQGAMVGAAGAIQVAKIVSSALGFARGGEVTGGSGTRDDVPAMLTGGEHVMQVPAVRKYGADFMDAVNNMRLPKEAVEGIMSLQHNVPGVSEPAAKTFFGTGGAVVPMPSASAATTQAKQQPTTIVNVIDPDMLSQFVATSKGENAIWNLLSNNPRKLKALMARG